MELVDFFFFLPLVCVCLSVSVFGGMIGPIDDWRSAGT